MNVHIRSRPYKCRVVGCDADFNELSNRNAHEKGVHKFVYKDIASQVATAANASAVEEAVVISAESGQMAELVEDDPTTLTISI